MEKKFFVIEGTDGSGKGTQSKLLVERIREQGLAVTPFAFPQYEKPTGQIIKAYLSGVYGGTAALAPETAAVLFAMDQAAAKPEIEACLARGEVVIADRFVTSNIGHQGARIPIEDVARHEQFVEMVLAMSYQALQFPRPDLTIILHVPTEISLQLIEARGREKDEHESNVDHLRAAEKAYLDMVASLPNTVVISCAPDGVLLSKEEVHAKVWEQITAFEVGEKSQAELEETRKTNAWVMGPRY
jgi:dTMP kinase